MLGKQYRLGDQIITGYDDFFYAWEMQKPKAPLVNTLQPMLLTVCLPKGLEKS